MVKHRRNARLTSATGAVIEQLDRRQLLTAISHAGPGSEVFQYTSANGFVRVVLGGDIEVELIGLEVHPGSDDPDNPIPVGQRTLVDMRPFTDELPEPDEGADIYHMYIRSAGPDSFISVGSISGPGTSPNPMQVLAGAPSLAVP